MKHLVKVYKNGTKEYAEIAICDRCGGTGQYRWGAIINGMQQYSGECFKCNGSGEITIKTLEYTPEHEEELRQAKERKEEKRMAELKEQEEMVAEWRRQEEERKQAEEDRKQISEYIGQIGEKITVTVTSVRWFDFETQWGRSGCYCFTDTDGNQIRWFTQADIDTTKESFKITGTVKKHNEYDGEKQTVITRVKVSG